MRVSAKADYALRALIEMANPLDGDGRPVSAEELGRRQDIPHNFLQAILADLRKSGIVLAQRGQSGGWRLAKAASDVTVADGHSPAVSARVFDGSNVSPMPRLSVPEMMVTRSCLGCQCGMTL